MGMTLDDIRQADTDGTYTHLSDDELADQIYNKYNAGTADKPRYYKDEVSREDFNKALGYTPAQDRSPPIPLEDMDPISRAFMTQVYNRNRPQQGPLAGVSPEEFKYGGSGGASTFPPAPPPPAGIQEGHEFDAPARGSVSLLKPGAAHYMDLLADAVTRGWAGLGDTAAQVFSNGPLAPVAGFLSDDVAAALPHPVSSAADDYLKSHGVNFQPQNTGESVAHGAIGGAPTLLFGGVPGLVGMGTGAWDATARALGLPDWLRKGTDLAPALIAPGVTKARENFFTPPKERALSTLSDIAHTTADQGLPGKDLETLRRSGSDELPPWSAAGLPPSLADEGGPLFRAEAERIAQNSTKASGAGLRAAFDARSTGVRDDEATPSVPAQSGHGTRMSENIDAFLGTKSEGKYTTEQGLIADQKKNAQPHYDAAEAHPWNQQMTSPGIDKVLSQPAGKKALAMARTAMQNRGLPTGDIDAALSEDGPPSSNGFKIRTLQFVKQALDRQYEQASPRDGSPGNGEDPVGIDRQRKTILREIDRLDATTPYKEQDMGPWRDPNGKVQPKKLVEPTDDEGITNQTSGTTIRPTENGKFDVETPNELRRFSTFEEARQFAQDRWNRNAPGAEALGKGEHAQARAIWSDAESAKSALQAGADVFRGNGKQADQIKAEIAKLSDGDKALYRQGMRTEAVKAAEKNGGLMAFNMTGKTGDRDVGMLAKFKAAGSEDDFIPFRRAVAKESNAYEAMNEILRNSRTALRESAARAEGERGGTIRDLADIGTGTLGLAKGEVGYGLERVARGSGNLGARLFPGRREAVDQELSNRLRPQMSPADWNRVIDEIMAHPRTPQRMPFSLVPPAIVGSGGATVPPPQRR